MSKAAAVAQPASSLSRFWHKWRFHINVLLVLIPLGFMPKYFSDVSLDRGDQGLGQREVGEIQVGPWSLRLAEDRNEAPRLSGPSGYMKVSTRRCATPASTGSRPLICASANHAACAPPG